MSRAKYIRIPKEEVVKHWTHDVKLDFGSASWHGARRAKTEYYLWCRTCKDTIGNTIMEVEHL